MSEPSDQQSPSNGLRQTTERALSGSAIINTVLAHVGRYVRASFLYRWLTAEPDPEVIVIDLRETWTVGPILALLEKGLTESHRARTGSRVELLFEATTTALQASPVRVIGLVGTTLGATLTIATLLRSGAMTSAAIGLVVLLVGVTAMRDDRDWETLRETQFVEFLRQVLKPPVPPADAKDYDSRKKGI